MVSNVGHVFSVDLGTLSARVWVDHPKLEFMAAEWDPQGKRLFIVSTGSDIYEFAANGSLKRLVSIGSLNVTDLEMHGGRLFYLCPGPGGLSSTGAPDLYVPRPVSDFTLPGGDRRLLWRPRSHDGHVRLRQDQPAGEKRACPYADAREADRRDLVVIHHSSPLSNAPEGGRPACHPQWIRCGQTGLLSGHLPGPRNKRPGSGGKLTSLSPSPDTSARPLWKELEGIPPAGRPILTGLHGVIHNRQGCLLIRLPIS